MVTEKDWSRAHVGRAGKYRHSREDLGRFLDEWKNELVEVNNRILLCKNRAKRRELNAEKEAIEKQIARIRRDLQAEEGNQKPQIQGVLKVLRG